MVKTRTNGLKSNGHVRKEKDPREKPMVFVLSSLYGSLIKDPRRKSVTDFPQ